jgi:hypothetical protein
MKDFAIFILLICVAALMMGGNLYLTSDCTNLKTKSEG